MKLSNLKKIRVAISLAFIISIAALFLDFNNYLSPRYTNYFTYLQFVPSFVKFLGLISITSSGVIIVFILTVLFGRVYCSSICPMGTLQDIFSYLSRKIIKRKYYRLLKPSDRLRYSFLSLSIIFLIFGSLFVINLLDPYSNFGRIFTQLLKPVIILGNNLLAYLLEKINIYSIYPVSIKPVNYFIILFPLAFLILVFCLSFFYGRLFCNSVCPVGTLLGLVSRFSLYKIKIDKENCISCKLCERVCKSGCIDKKNKIIDFSRCVSCYNCFTVCPTNGIKYQSVFNNKGEADSKEIDYNKRNFLISLASFLAISSGGVLAQTKIVSKTLNKVSIFKKYAITPPGSLGLKHFTSNCTACHLCISACPTQVLQPSFLEYGILGILQPQMDYKANFCNFDCVICSQVCPNGAILPVKLNDKKQIQLGKANIVKDNCIAYTEKTDCGACAEYCPTKAVVMVPYENIRSPEVNDEYCIGCGACEYACPARPNKAIYVEGNYIHQKAKKKEVKKLEEKINYKEDFPF